VSLFERLVREVHAERHRQDEKWGVQNHPMTLDDTLHGSDWWRGLADIWKRENDFRVQRGTQRGLPKDRNCAWDGIFIEEIAETFAEERPGLQYAEAVQAAGVAFAILDFLNRQSMELRGHYAGCPALDVDGLVHAPEACDCNRERFEARDMNPGGPYDSWAWGVWDTRDERWCEGVDGNSRSYAESWAARRNAEVPK
jgi:hypothetical protein